MRTLVGVVGVVLLVACAPASARAQERAPAPTTYVVKRGDTLYSLARRFGTSVETLRRLNDLPNNTIHIGQELVVRPPRGPTPVDTTTAAPSPSTDTPPSRLAPRADSARSTPDRIDAAAPALSASDTLIPASRTLIGAAISRLVYGAYVVRPGDTFFSVAARYGTTADSLFALNGRYRNPLPPGRVLRLPARFALPTHVVQERDSTIYGIAAQYGVSVRALQHANDLTGAGIDVGQRLRIPGRPAPEPAARGTLPEVDARGPVAVYPDTYAGRLTASGARYDPDRLVVSHPELPFGSIVLLTNPATGRSTFARLVDRGPIDEALLIDVSPPVAERLGLAPGSEQPITLRIVR